MNIILYEDDNVKNFFPLTQIKPFQFLLNGCLSIYQRFNYIFDTSKLKLFTRSELSKLLLEKYNFINFSSQENRTSLFINSRVKQPEELKVIINKITALEEYLIHNGDTILAIKTKEHNFSKIVKNDISFFSTIQKQETQLTTYLYPWELVNDNASKINTDLKLIEKNFTTINQKNYPYTTLINKENIYCKDNITINAGVIIDATNGPVILEDSATIMHNSIIIGPCYIGAKTSIKIAAKIYENCSFGARCKIGGEVEGSIISGYSNKQHDGFLGHAYIGEWCNLGADTNNSDLKNNYSDVIVEINNQLINTKSLFVGLFMGDHSKTGINTMFNTGTVVGIGCNIFGAGFPPRNIPNLNWGGMQKLIKYPKKRIIETAKIVMKRRDIELTNAEEELLNNL